MKCSAKGVQNENDVTGSTPPAPGTYLFCVKTACERPTKKNGDPIDGARIVLQCCGGTVPGQEGREFDMMLWYDKDTNEATEVHLRFALAAGLVKPGEEKDVDLDRDAPGRLLFVKLDQEDEQKKDAATGKYVSTGKKVTRVGNRGMDMWGVGNKEMEGVRQIAAVAKVIATFQGGAGVGGSAGGASKEGAKDGAKAAQEPQGKQGGGAAEDDWAGVV